MAMLMFCSTILLMSMREDKKHGEIYHILLMSMCEDKKHGEIYQWSERKN
jgi:ribonucleotide reductase beta subunit family protein with ferritin-like domain